MSEQTNIQWCDSTAGPWLICTEVSPGCGHCYARELMVSRLERIARKAYRLAGLKNWETRPVWGGEAPRILTRDFRGKMLAMNRKPWICDDCGAAYSTAQINDDNFVMCSCQGHIHRRRSFPSLIDWLDEMPAGILDQDGKSLDPIAVRADFMDTIRQCDQMAHILCTKRPHLAVGRLKNLCSWRAAQGGGRQPAEFFEWIEKWAEGTSVPKNIIVLASVENQAMADKRIPELLKIPAACRGLSLEPLLGPIDLRLGDKYGDILARRLRGESYERNFLDWLILGGESGPGARPCNVEWIRGLVAQGKAAGAAVFVKQLGSNPTQSLLEIGKPPVKDIPLGATRLILDKKGGDPNEWPEDLRVREFPEIKF